MLVQRTVEGTKLTFFSMRIISEHVNLTGDTVRHAALPRQQCTVQKSAAVGAPTSAARNTVGAPTSAARDTQSGTEL